PSSARCSLSLRAALPIFVAWPWRGDPLSRSLLLTGNRLCRTLASPRVGVSALTTHRQTLAVAQTTVAAQIHQALDVHGDFTPQVALDDEIAVDRLADARDLVIGQLVDTPVLGNANPIADLLGLGMANAVNISQRDRYALPTGNVDASDTCHAVVSLRQAF